MREAIEQRQLSLRRKKRLVIVRSVQIDQFVAKTFQHRERGRRAIDELAVAAAGGKRALDNQLVRARLHSRFLELRIQFREIFAGKNRFDRARFRAGADERFVRALAEEQLQRADDDRFARAGLAGDGGESRRDLPFQILAPARGS